MERSPKNLTSTGNDIAWRLSGDLGIVDYNQISTNVMTSTAVSLAGSTSSLDTDPGTRGLRNEDIRYEQTNPLMLTNFGFSVSGTIVGIELTVVGQRNSRILDKTVSLWHDGARIGKNQALSLDFDEFEHAPRHNNHTVYGADNSTWGAQLTAQIINSSNFGVVLEYTSNLWQPHSDRLLLDSVRMRVYTQ